MRAALMLSAALLVALPAAAQQEGYYYPPVKTEEVFDRVLADVPPAPRQVRIAFIDQVIKAQLDQPDEPRLAIFAKGSDAEHMIIVALEDDVFRTIYRARGVLAQLSHNARQTEFFVKNGFSSITTWFDLAKALGFEDIVISDGVSWSHRVILIQDGG